MFATAKLIRTYFASFLGYQSFPIFMGFVGNFLEKMEITSFLSFLSSASDLSDRNRNSSTVRSISGMASALAPFHPSNIPAGISWRENSR